MCKMINALGFLIKVSLYCTVVLKFLKSYGALPLRVNVFLKLCIISKKTTD